MTEKFEGADSAEPKRPPTRRSPGSALAKYQAQLQAIKERAAQRRLKEKEQAEAIERQMAQLQAQARRQEREAEREEEAAAIRGLGRLILELLIAGQEVGAPKLSVDWSPMAEADLEGVRRVITRARTKAREREDKDAATVPKAEAPQLDIDIRLDGGPTG